MIFTEDEVEELTDREVDTIVGDSRRWQKSMTTIALHENGKHYRIEWQAGLTECQENDYPEQEAVEVELTEREVTKTIKEWIPVT